MPVEYTTLRVPAKELEQAKEAKQANETWGEYLLRCADADIPRKWTQKEIEDIADRCIADASRDMRP